MSSPGGGVPRDVFLRLFFAVQEGRPPVSSQLLIPRHQACAVLRKNSVLPARNEKAKNDEHGKKSCCGVAA